MKLFATAIFTLLLSAFAVSATAEQTYTYPILNDYKAAAEKVFAQAQAATTTEEYAALKPDTEVLVHLGVQIMDLYAQKNPICLAQFQVFISEIPQMDSMPLDEVHERYHNGKGLPEAPRHCYMGRSQVVHPVMNLIRIKGEIDTETREELLHEYEEVIEHLERIQKNLDTPPN